MNSPLRLMIELEPLQLPVPDILASITLRYDELTCSGGMLTTAATLSEKEINELRWYLEEYWQWPYEQFKERAKKIEHNLADIGKRLYHAVFGTVEAQQLVQPWNLQPDADRQISIISDIPAVLSLPWELLHDERGFLALRSKHPVSIVRQISQKSAATLKTTFEPPLRILLVTARPDDAGFVDPRSIARELLTAISAQVEAGTIALEFLRPPTLTHLRTRLSNDKLPPIHILHFDGHGIFGEMSGANDGLMLKSDGPRGMLAFENEGGKEDLISAEDLAQVLQDSGIKLAVFNACQSAVVDSDDLFSSVATRMIKGGIDGVVAMSASVLVAAATCYVEAFYTTLATGTAVPLSQERARQALHTNPRRHLTRRTQDEEGEPVRLRDWWLPHYYQQRPVVFEASKKARRKKTSANKNAPLLNEDMPKEPRYGFTGRALELLKIERALLQKKLVVIHGFGGMGKTALAREAADWFTRTGMYKAACFVSFEHGGDTTTLLSAIGNFLGINDGNYSPNDPTVALARIKTAVSKRPILVIADNLESILPNGEVTLELALRTQLWSVLLKLREMGIGVLLTSRDTTFGDGQLAPGKYVMHLPLAGLYHEDAYILASNLLDNLGIDRSRAPYAELRDLLKQLDYHPLAIQLVLPQLQHLSTHTIRTEFAALLLKFKDDTTTGRNSSLLASLDYSLNRLTLEQKELLPRLSIFEGGAMELDLLVITEIPEDVWASLRPALEQAALLTAEQAHEAISVPFLHFHPVLVPYLRSRAAEEDAVLRERYTQQYYYEIIYGVQADLQNPELARAIVRRELPNLRKALDLLVQAGDVDAASSIADSIIRFLNAFGMTREIEQVRRQITKAMETGAKTGAGALTNAEYLHESGLAEDERMRGDIQLAYNRLISLLVRIETAPEGFPRGRGSLEHCSILLKLAMCFRSTGQLEETEETLQKASSFIDILLTQDPDNQSYISEHAHVLYLQGDVLRIQGRYKEAEEMYEQALVGLTRTNDVRNQAIILDRLGWVALEQRNFDEAQGIYLKTLDAFRALGEPAMQAVVWHQLGRIAEGQKQWAEAERCYRKSLAIKERIGDKVLAAQTCNQLATVAQSSGRPTEAEGWYKRAIQLQEQVQLESTSHANILSNFANLLVSEVALGRAAKARLAEARRYVEQAKHIFEQPGVSVAIWSTFAILAQIADLEEQPEEARDYRRRERESFAAFAGNRYHIDQQHSGFIAAIVVATRGNAEVRNSVEETLPKFEKAGWHITQAVQRIWAGERKWHMLVENLDRPDAALLILRVLETLQETETASFSAEEEITVEELVASLPADLLEAMEQGNVEAFDRVLEGLSAEEQVRVAGIFKVFGEAQEEGEDDLEE